MTATVIGAICLITLLTLLIPTINIILNESAINLIDNLIDNLEFFIGSTNLNTFLMMIALLMIIIIYKRANKFFHGTD